MATVPNSHSVQDMPPKGGFQKIRIENNVPANRGFRGWVLFAGMGAGIVYGFVKLYSSSKTRRDMKRERRQLRVAILPFLQAEEDVLACKNIAEKQKREMEIMKHVPNWDALQSVYHSNVYVRPRGKGT